MDSSVSTWGDQPPASCSKLTFRDLKAERKKLVGPDQRDKNEFASSLTALRNFMIALGAADDDACVPLLGLSYEEFEARLRDFESRTTAKANTIVAYRSRLRRWNEIAGDLAEQSRTAPTLISDVLVEAITAYRLKQPGASDESIARAAEMPVYRFRLWQEGRRALITSNNVRWARGLEKVLSLRPEALTSRLLSGRKRFKSLATVNSERRLRLDKFGISNIKFRPQNLSHILEDFFLRLRIFKTSAIPSYNVAGEALKRSKSKWRVTATNTGERAVPAAEALMIHMRTLIGWLVLPATLEEAHRYVLENRRDHGQPMTDDDIRLIAPHFVGKGLKLDELTPAHLADPDLLGSFIEWQKARNGAAQWDTVGLVLALLAIDTGFLSQQVEYAWGYVKLNLTPVEAKLLNTSKGRQLYHDQRRRWSETCARWRSQLSGLRGFTQTVRSRRARDRLLSLIEHPDPLSVINDLIQAHASDKPVGKLEPGHPGARDLALWWRDQLLLRMLTANPLHNRNFRDMRYRENPTTQDKGNLYRTEGDGWRFQFKPGDFKNERGAAKELYDVEVPADLWPLIEVYLYKARPILINQIKTELVFISKSGKAFERSTDFSALIWGLTSRYMQGVKDVFGIRSQAFRHIIATAWLRSHPEDYLTVAQILHDDLATVLKNYAHNKPGEGLRRYNDWCGQKVKPLMLDPMV